MVEPRDEPVDDVVGMEIPSDVVPGVHYRMIARVGEGGMAVAYYALRVAPEGDCPVVVKVMRPAFVRHLGPTAALIVKKEAIALGRLNERVPPTPFVVRFIDTGLLPGGPGEVDLPWVAVEYVHGGAEGTTLSERVVHSLKSTGFAFDSARAAHAIECLAHGLVAVHEMGVIHRDVKPDNVLCCGFGEAEIFKIADFGVARPVGVQATFGGMIVGTLGYAAPELAAMDKRAIGSWSDVFSLASVIYFLLTGEDYFSVDTPADAIVAACSPDRRSIRDARGLSPELRAREQACRSIDFALACATSAKIENRPQRADALAAMLVPWLRLDARRPRATLRLLAASLESGLRQSSAGYAWTVLQRSGTGRLIRSVAWDGDGRCLAATSDGLSFWNGTGWTEASLDRLPNPSGIRFVRRVAAGRWLVGGDDATIATYTSEGVTDVFRLEERSIRFDLLSGELDDLAVLVGQTAGEPPTLCALSSRRWLKPLRLDDVAWLASLARIEDDRWLLAGRGADGQAFAAVYSPLDWDVQRIKVAEVRSFLACAGQWERGVGVATGADGAVVWVEGQAAVSEQIDAGIDVSAAGVDAVGRGWAAGAGHIWRRTSLGAGVPGRWERVWHEPAWSAPIVSIFPDVGSVLAMTADGGIVEGRAIV